ncbi:hypothetical protein KIH27_16125 [Mycobacterium sp. M1]|uniref:Uncharacterized protein n=1 Tax=Mycolicibacter acidiphilus TaxID=2835306 RepID=A0ABS5RNQ5_9MYCO|nr:hypothetical protein [Mycolicibacter acidiphilus]MBS9535116.1 hypothetical protein [Mycolicibacter acidiphilus]
MTAAPDFLALYTDDSDHALLAGWDGAAWAGMWADRAESARMAHLDPNSDAAVLDVFKAMFDLAVERGLCAPPIDTTGWENW